MSVVDRRPVFGIGWPAVVGLVALALFARAVPVLRGAGLTGDIGYDDGVYFGAAIAFVHGALPYRDVLLLHPPGMLALLSPFAALGAITNEGTGFALARAAFMLLGVANTLLVARLASRQGRTAGILAGVIYAAWHAAAGFERTTLLVPPQTALLLVALLCLDRRDPNAGPSSWRRRHILAGACLGFAISIQLWAVVPVFIIGCWLVVRDSKAAGRLRLPVAFTVSTTVAFAAVVLPFLATAGGAMIREILLDQLGRPNNAVSLVVRLRTLEGLGQTHPHLPDMLPLAGAVAAAIAVAWIARRSSWVRIFAILFAVQSAVILLTPVSFPHYSAWPAAAGAVTFGIGGKLFLDLMRTPRLARLAVVGYALLAAILLVPDVPASGQRLQLDALASDVASARCVASDEPALLIELSRIGRQVASGCPIVMDPTGVAYDTDRGLLTPGSVAASRTRAVNFQHAMLAYFGTAEAALFARPASIGLSAQTWAAIRCALTISTQRGTVLVLKRSATGAPAACSP